jgi:hypothetical protein
MTGMHAHIGDQLVIFSHTLDRPERDGEILETHGPDGSPPFLVRWSDGGTSLVFPGPDAHVHPPAAAQG